ncbi:uncharacterized protein ACN427_009384 isoform 1-T1 [Glossina fuscipes fuscipes]
MNETKVSATSGNELQNETNSNQTVQKEEDSTAEAYLDHLLNNGCNEGDSEYEMEMPSWYNDTLFREGQTYMSKYRFVLQSGMLAGLIAVLSVPSILKVLMCTRQSSTPSTAYRRYLRTILHTQAWYEYPPEPRNSKFWISLQAVRKAHSRSSRACAKLGSGMITQKDLALTQFGFIGFITLGAYRIQLYDQEFLEATSHMWRVLGYLLGIKDEYNICGKNWSETNLRLDIVLRKVYIPALENASKDFEDATKALLHGLWPVNTSLTVGSYLFMTKRLACVKGYEYYEFDHRPGAQRDPNQHLYYKDLNWWDRFIVFYGLFLVTYLHKYNAVRWYLNFRVWLNEQISYYVPYVAMFMFGFKLAFVRIFTKAGSENDFKYHLKIE